MFRRLLFPILAVLALPACTLLQDEPAAPLPTEPEPTPDSQMVSWLEDYCSLEQVIPQEVRDALLPPGETTDADREALIGALTEADAALVEVDAAAEALEPAPEVIGDEAIPGFQSDVADARGSLALFLETAAEVPGSGLVSLYEGGQEVLERVGPAATYYHVQALWPEVQAALVEAPACSPIVEVLQL